MVTVAAEEGETHSRELHAPTGQSREKRMYLNLSITAIPFR